MDKPAILCVDDEPAVLSAIARDLRREYASDYRVVRADSGESALEALRQLKLRGDEAALLISDQRMPEMSGVEFLEQAREIYPNAKRVLLTAYADTEAAIRAINDVQLDYYLMKPWDPPEERLYPVLSDLLDDWQAAAHPTYEGVRVVGHRWSAGSHDIRDFLARNLVPYHWLDVESDADAIALLEMAGYGVSSLPVVILPDGSSLVQPSLAEIADRVGMRTRAAMPSYDVVIVGGGPAGLGAAVYAASEGLSTLLVEREAVGGQAGTSSFIENYLGFPRGISGSELMRRAKDQAARFGVEILTPVAVTGLALEDPYRVLALSDGSKVGCKALVIASGVQYRRLDAPGVDRLTGAGVFYGAATTEARETRDQEVFVVGGGNSAGQGAVHLSQFARSVTILIRGPSLSSTMSQYLIDRIEETPNITVLPCSQVAEVHGDDRLEAVSVSDSQTGMTTQMPANALFIFIGALPRTDWVEGKVERDRYGFLPTGEAVLRDGTRPRGWWPERDPFWLETSVPGIFAAGDVRSQSLKRCASAVGEGAMAVSLVHQHLAGL